jgi:fructose-bisphosphate aldolase class II
MKTLRQCVVEAKENKVAVGHFNFATIEVAEAIVEAAQELNVPVILGTAEGEEGFVGTEEAVALVKTFREKHNIPIFLNADHHYNFESVKKCIDAGYDMVIFDGAKLPLEENIKITKECVDYARTTGRDVLVEAELGYIGQASAILDAIPEGVGLSDSELTKPDEAKAFIDATGVDMFAPSVGNVHGMLRNVPDPALNIERIREISEAVTTPLVLHGASGNSDTDIRSAIEAGISVVHVNTELRRAWTDAMKIHMTEHPDDVAPYKILKESREAVKQVVLQKLKVFNNL